ncbi:MAG TPA: phytanoyl-CoA dioxygenase family protein [Chloroflexota bacterium]
MSGDGSEIATLATELEEYGFVVVPELLSRQEAAGLARAAVRILSRRPDAAEPEVQLRGILNELPPSDYESFLPLMSHPIVLELARGQLGPDFEMAEFSLRLRKPGAPADALRVTRPLDSIVAGGLPMPNLSFVLACSWLLSDLTRQNGGRIFVPFSHHARRLPRPGVEYRFGVNLEAPAGSLVVFHDAVWHNFSAYEGSGEGRVELNGGYCARWMNPAVNDYSIVRKSVHARLPPALQRLNRNPAADQAQD